MADYEARARRVERQLPGDPEVRGLLSDIAARRDSAIEALESFVTYHAIGGVH